MTDVLEIEQKRIDRRIELFKVFVNLDNSLPISFNAELAISFEKVLNDGVITTDHRLELEKLHKKIQDWINACSEEARIKRNKTKPPTE
jgi:hypothetical protein